MKRLSKNIKFQNNAIYIAVKNVSDCMTNDGIIAGTHHFVDLWARDSLFATFGTTATGDYKNTKKTIETFLRFQRADGLIPYRILRSPTTIGKYFGKPAYFKTPKADFRSHQSGGLVLDGGLMTVIATAQYIRVSQDNTFLKKHFQSLRRGMDWYVKRFGEGLTKEWFLCEWADAVLKAGKVLYTNVLYYKALSDMAYLARLLGNIVCVDEYRARGNSIFKKIQNDFWNGRYFTDWIDYKPQNYFASGQNMLAVLFDLTTKKQTESILSLAVEHCWNGWTLETNYPKYPWWRVPLLNYIVGMGDYHNRGCLWLQPGILYALALTKFGNSRDAKHILEEIAKKIIQYDQVYEVYEKDGRPISRFFYHSEGPFAWSAGLFIYAYFLIHQKKGII